MGNIEVGRYPPDMGHVNPDGPIAQTWQGWIQDEARTWIAFIDMEGRPTFYLHRDERGGVIDQSVA